MPRNRRNWKPRLTGPRWERLRRYVLDRDSWCCTKCGWYGRLEVHHRDGDPMNNDPSNLLTLCRGCHIRHHAPALSPAAQAWMALVDSTRRR